MKRVRTWMLALVLALSMCAPVCGAEEQPVSAEIVSTSVEYLDDGDYIETVIAVLPSEEALGDASVNTANTYQLTATKTAAYKNSSGETLWSVSVTGTFVYSKGVSVSCTAATATSQSYSSAWKVGTASASYSGNSATGKAVGKKYVLFVVTKTLEISTTLTCDVNGNLS